MRTDLVPATRVVWKPPKRSAVSALRMIWRRRFVVAAAAVLLSAVSSIVVHRLPAVYRAETVILVESQRIPERFVPPTVSNELKDRLATLSQQILSYSRLLEVVERFDLYREERATYTREEIVEMMRADVGLNLDQGSPSRSRAENRPSAFRVSYQGPNPEVVALVANQLGGLFIDENLRSREVQAVGTSEFLGTQLAEAKKRLEEQEARLSIYKLKFNGELPEQENMLLASLGQLQLRHQAASDTIIRAEQTKTIIESSIGSAEDTERAISQLTEQVGSAAQPVAANDQEFQTVETLRQRIATVESVLGENHPELILLRQRLEQEEKRAASSAPALPGSEAARPGPGGIRGNEIRLQRQERISALRAQVSIANDQLQKASAERDRIGQEIVKVQQRLGRIPIREQELTVVRRDYEISRSHYQSLLDKGLSADLAAEMERRQKAERFTIIDPARVPQKPVRPNRPMLYAIVTTLSCVVGIAIGFGREARRNVFLGEWDVPRGVPVLGRIPSIITTRPIYEISPARRRRRMAWVLVAAMLLVGAAATAAAYYFGWIPQEVLGRLRG
jgi:polysaccharide biosynthesis transport protein